MKRVYYRHKRVLKDLAQAILPPSKAPKHRNKTQWGEAEKQLVLEVRRDNETFGILLRLNSPDYFGAFDSLRRMVGSDAGGGRIVS